MAVLGKASSGGGQLPTISFMTSQTWTPSYDLTAYVYVIGGGGSGGATHNNVGGAVGGGAGGCAVSKLDLKSGTTYTIAIGAGGDRANASSTTTNGNAGGATTFSGSGISTMTGNGGAGGGTRASNDSTHVTGAAGGTATGGTLGNFTGGKGSAITASVNNTAYVMGGGGAVGLWATGNDAPDAFSHYGYTAMGGMLNVEKGDLNPYKFFNRATDSSAGDHHENSFPTVEAFIGVLTTEVNYDNYQVDYDATFEKRTGAMDAKGYGFVRDSKLYMGMSAPFQGANGVSGGTVYGQRGCAGSGGGGSYGYSAATNSGGGGNGLVLIFPTSIGA
tara:strand:- start:43342 stop:44337 length:996 start_codon:yes stop_codon:yes gene_type:complete